MAIKNGKQPQCRFDVGGPYSIDGISYLPKVVFFKVSGISGTATHAVWAAPAGTRIVEAFIRVDTTVDQGTIYLGNTGHTDSLITATVCGGAGSKAAGNFYSNLMSTVQAEQAGTYLASGDTVNFYHAGTATTGAISGYLTYFEVEAMVSDGYHISV